MPTSLSLRVASTFADLDMPTAQLVIELALDGLYQLPDDEFNPNRVLSNLEYALAEQEREFMRHRSVYGFSQSNSVAAIGSLSNVRITDTGNSSNGTDQGGNEGPSHGMACPSDFVDDLPSIRSETDNEDEDDPRAYDAYSLAGASEPYDDLPSIRSETPELPDDIANNSRPGSDHYLEKPQSLEYLPSIRSETPTFSRDEDDDDDDDDGPVSDDAYTLADGNIHYDDLPSICSETRGLSEEDYSLVDSAHESPTDSMFSWATLVSSDQSTVSSEVIRADTPISPESLVADVHDASVPTGTGMLHSLHRCSKALLNAIDGIGCIRWRRIKYGILGSIWAPQTQGSPASP